MQMQGSQSAVTAELTASDKSKNKNNYFPFDFRRKNEDRLNFDGVDVDVEKSDEVRTDRIHQR